MLFIAMEAQSDKSHKVHMSHSVHRNMILAGLIKG